MVRLTEQDVQRFQRLLAKRRKELRWLIHDALIESRHTDYIELAGAVHDSGEEAVANLLSEMDISQLRREVEEIGDVETALERIKHGSFRKMRRLRRCHRPRAAGGLSHGQALHRLPD